MDLRPARPDDAPSIEALLRAARLDADGVDARLDSTVVADDGGTLLGTASAEAHGADVLLRSFAVAPEARGRGLGSALCEALLATPACRRARDAYLLTTDAAPFFARLGFAAADRAGAPAAIAASDQFARQCPASATFMHRRLHAGIRAR